MYVICLAYAYTCCLILCAASVIQAYPGGYRVNGHSNRPAMKSMNCIEIADIQNIIIIMSSQISKYRLVSIVGKVRDSRR
jgi:hypothetical protein